MVSTISPDTLAHALADGAAANGLEVVDVEIGGAQHAPLVRVYLDRDGGIDIDAIAAANAWIKPVLDEIPQMGERYTLEVSSPGLERPLKTLEQFERFAGRRAKLTVTRPVGGARRLTAVIVGVQGDDVLVDIDGDAARIPISTVSKARLVPEIDFG